MNSVSPLRYPGGKACLYPFLQEVVASNNLHIPHYCEPFAGGCGLALSLLFGGDVSDIHINDIDPSIWSFWRSVLDDTDNLVRLIERTPVTIQERDRQKAVHERGDISNPLRLGFSAFFLNRTSRSGIIRGSGAIGGKDQTGAYKIDCRFNKTELVRRIRRISMYRQRIHLSKLDAIDFMKQKGADLPRNSLFCIDPPYFAQGAKLYTNSFSPEDHERVARAIQRLKQPYLVTYDNAPLIARLFSLRRRYLLSLTYSLQVKRVGTELVIVSDKLLLNREQLLTSRVVLSEYVPALA